jgi:Tol biopolymer transport system component
VNRFPVIIASVLALALAAACSDSDSGSEETPSSTPADSSPPSAVAAQGNDAFLLYREASGSLVAQHLDTGETYRYEVDFNKEVIVSAECSDDGSRIAYLRQEFSQRDRLLDIHGKDAPTEPLPLPSSVQAFAWAPDGSAVAIADYDGHAQTHNIAVVDIATGRQTTLASGPDFAGSLSYSPDGSQIAYYLQRISDGDTQVYVVPAGGGKPSQRTSGDTQWYDPDWAPDGNSILVAGLEAESFQLYEINAENGEPTPVTRSEIFKRGPEYSPDGALIAYTGSIVLPQVALYPAASLHSFGIFLVGADGANEHAFTADPRLNPGAQVDPYLDAYLVGWCPPGPWLDDAWQPAAVTTTPSPQ